MTLEEKLLSLLAGSPVAVPTLGTRIYPVTAPQAIATPYAVYMVISRERMEAHEENPLGLRTWHYQFSVFAATYSAARTGLAGILSTLVGYFDADGAGIRQISLESQRTLWEEESKFHHHSADLEIWERLT